MFFFRHLHTGVYRFGVKNHYQVLGVSRDASSKEIRAAFIRLSKQLHPDVNELTPRKNDVSFVDVNEAYSILSNPSTRKEYDLRQTKGPLMNQNTGPFTRNAYRPEYHHHFYRPGYEYHFYRSQQNMYHYSKEQGRYSNGTVAGFLCIFVIVGSLLQFLRLSEFMKTQRTAAERSQLNYTMLYAKTREREQRSTNQ